MYISLRIHIFMHQTPLINSQNTPLIFTTIQIYNIMNIYIVALPSARLKMGHVLLYNCGSTPAVCTEANVQVVCYSFYNPPPPPPFFLNLPCLTWMRESARASQSSASEPISQKREADRPRQRYFESSRSNERLCLVLRCVANAGGRASLWERDKFFICRSYLV